MNSTNIPISTSKKTPAGSSRSLTDEQNKYSLGNENADDEHSLGNENVGTEVSCLTSTVTNNPSSFYFKIIKTKTKNKKGSRSDMLFDRLNYSMNCFMKAQNQADNEFLSILLKKKE